VDELVEHWTVLEDEQQLVAGKRGATRLGFALLLQFYTRLGRFPRGRSELPQEAVDSSLPVRCTGPGRAAAHHVTATAATTAAQHRSERQRVQRLAPAEQQVTHRRRD